MIKNFNFIICILLLFSACREKPSPTANGEVGSDLVAVLTEAIKQNQLDPALRLKRAKLLAEMQRYPEAIEDMRIAIIRDSLQARYYHLLSDLFMDSNNSSKGLLTMKTAGRLFPDSTMTQLKLAETQYILKQYGDATLTVNGIIRTQPQNAEAYFMLGLIFKESGEIAKAINAFQAATEFDNRLVDAWINLGQIFEAKKETIASRYYKTATEVDPNNIAALHSYAYFLQNSNQIDEAITLYKKINIVNPEYVDAYLNAGILYLERKEMAASLEQFDIMTKINPIDARGFYFKALTLFQQGDKVNARTQVQNALNIEPNYEDAQKLKAKL
jgi:tetratricopeptide (TPR) repeat protein